MSANSSSGKPALWPILLGSTMLFVIGMGPFLLERALYDFAIWNPYSLVTIVPASLIGGLLGVDPDKTLFWGALIGPIAFALTARSLMYSGKTLPRGSVVAFFIVLTLSTIFAVISFEATVRFTSLGRAVFLVMQSAVPPLALIAATLKIKDQLTINRSIVLHWFAFAWFSWSAFPWYGELI